MDTTSQYILPGRPLRLAQDTLKHLARIVGDLVEMHEAGHSEHTRRIDVAWKLYRGEPRVARRSDPFIGASNIVLPLVRIHSDALSSRLFNTLFATRQLWSAPRYDETLGEGPRHACEWLNIVTNDNELQTSRPMLEVFREGVPVGQGVWQLGWGRKVRTQIDPASLRTGGAPKFVPVEMHNGPTLSWVPRRCIMWQPGRALVDAEWVVKQTTMSFSDIVHQTRYGTWDKAAVQSIKGQSAVLGGARNYRMGNRAWHMPGPEQFREYDIREVWIDLPCLSAFGLDTFDELVEKFYSPAIVVHMHRDTRTVLNVMAQPYAIAHWPFYDFSFRGAGSDMDEGGVAMMLQHMQAAGSTLINQAIDAVTIANSMMGITNQKELLDKKLAPNRWFYVPDVSEGAVRPIQLAKLVSPDIQLLQLILQIAERVVPAFDREGRSGGHPSPATSTLTLLAESKETLQTTLKMVRARMGQMGEDIFTLYQQFLTPESLLERVRRTVGPADAQKVVQFMAARGGAPVGFDMRALTEELNPEAARNRAILVDQATTNYYGRVLQLLQVLSQPQSGPQTPTGAVAIKFLDAITESYREILHSADVDEVERFLLELNSSRQPDPRLVAGLSQYASQRLADSGGAAPNPGVGSTGGGPSVPADLAGFAAEQANAPVQGIAA